MLCAPPESMNRPRPRWHSRSLPCSGRGRCRALRKEERDCRFYCYFLVRDDGRLATRSGRRSGLEERDGACRFRTSLSRSEFRRIISFSSIFLLIISHTKQDTSMPLPLLATWMKCGRVAGGCLEVLVRQPVISVAVLTQSDSLATSRAFPNELLKSPRQRSLRPAIIL